MSSGDGPADGVYSEVGEERLLLGNGPPGYAFLTQFSPYVHALHLNNLLVPCCVDAPATKANMLERKCV